MLWVFDSAEPKPTLPVAVCLMLPSNPLYGVGTREKLDFGVQCPGLDVPLPLLHPRSYHRQRTTQGQRIWLGFHCKTLSFSTSNRFIPALSERPAYLHPPFQGGSSLSEGRFGAVALSSLTLDSPPSACPELRPSAELGTGRGGESSLSEERGNPGC
jgi:hypothetical protein